MDATRSPSTNDGRVMAEFVALCSEKDEERFLLFV